MSSGNSSIIPFLWFENQAEDAARYYAQVFPGARLGEICRFPAGGYGPEGSVMAANFELGGQRMVALNGNRRHPFSPAMSLMYTCKDGAEAERLSETLAQGGEKQPGGWLRDKFGVSWQVRASA
jgi:predicted 3-demethylubiquinone-9 3-methyltransferase (glyoxalase superfamily)